MLFNDGLLLWSAVIKNHSKVLLCYCSQEGWIFLNGKFVSASTCLAVLPRELFSSCEPNLSYM